MVAGGMALILVGYGFAYSGLSNLLTGGKGWGFLQSMTGKGANTPLSLANFTSNITPLGNAGESAPASNPSPVNGAQQI